MQQGDAGTFQTKDDPQENINILGKKYVIASLLTIVNLIRYYEM